MQWVQYEYKDYPGIIAEQNIGLCINEYWAPVVTKMIEDLALLNNSALSIVQIKEKFGSLRVYCRGIDERAFKIIQEAQILCSKICAECGSEDDVKLHSSEDKPWLLPRCRACRT